MCPCLPIHKEAGENANWSIVQLQFTQYPFYCLLYKYIFLQIVMMTFKK